MKDNLILIVLYLGLSQGFFIILALSLIRKKRKDTLILLTSLVLCFCSLIFVQILKYYVPASEIIGMLKIGRGIPFLVGPLLYLYLRSVVDEGFKITLKDLAHFLPFFFFTTISFLSIFSSIAILILIVKSLHTLIYYLFSIRLLARKPKGKKIWYRRQLLLRLVWVQVAAFLAIHLIVILEMALPQFSIESDLVSSLIFVFFFFTFVLIIIVFPNGTIPNKLSPKYEQSILREDEKKLIQSDLLRLLREEKLFLNPDLSLGLVSDILELNSNHLSQVINELFGKNFSQFINEYRIEEVKKLMLKQEMTILSAAYASGFNSKSAFNRIFKEIEGMTPSAYRKKHIKKRPDL